MAERIPAATRPRFGPGHAVVALALALGAAALGLALSTDPGSASPPSASCGGSGSHLTVDGSGQASGSPNQLDFQAQVDVSAGSARSALVEDSTTSAAVVQAIESAGVPARDLQTTGLSVSPNLADVHGQSVVTGYGVSNDISVTVGKLALAGSVVDAASGAGGDAISIDGLSFVRSDPRALEDKARRDSVRQAVSHASAMARAAGERLAGVCSVTDDSAAATEPLAYGTSRGVLGAAGPATPPLEGGVEQASAQVTIVYALAPLDG